MYDGILNLNRIVNNYSLDHTLTEGVDYALVKSHTTNSPSNKQIIYCIKKESLKKDTEQLLFQFVKDVKENRVGLYPRLIELIQTQSNYYMVFDQANLLIDAAMRHLYRHPSQHATRDKIIILLLNICENISLPLVNTQFVVSGDRVFLLPHFIKVAGAYKPANRQLFMNLVYAICFGVNGEDDQNINRYRKFMMLEKNFYDRKDFLAILMNFIKEQDNNFGSKDYSNKNNSRNGNLNVNPYPMAQTTTNPQESINNTYNQQHQPNNVNNQPFLKKAMTPDVPTYKQTLVNYKYNNSTVNGKIQEETEQDLYNQINNIGLNPKTKQLASEIREGRKSLIRSGPIETPNLSELGIDVEPTAPQSFLPNTSPNISQLNPQQQPKHQMNSQLQQKQQPQQQPKHQMEQPKPQLNQMVKPPNPTYHPSHVINQGSQKPIVHQSQPQKTLQHTNLNNLFSKHKSIRYDEAPTHKSAQNPFQNQHQKNPNLQTIYMKKSEGIDETDQIFSTINTSFMAPANNKSENFKSFASKAFYSNKDIKGNDTSSPKTQFEMLFKAYMSQFNMLHAIKKSFLTYYQGTNMGIVAAYLIARCSVMRKLRLIDALIAEQNLFDTGTEIYKVIDKTQHIDTINSVLYKDDPNKVRQVINFAVITPDTLQILQPYLGEVDVTDRTQQITFYYLYCLSKKTPSKDMHNMLLNDCMYVLLHIHNEFVYDYSLMPKQWDEAYVNDKKKFIELLMYKVK